MNRARLVVFAGVLTLAACGGSAASYSADAFASCLRDHGATTSSGVGATLIRMGFPAVGVLVPQHLPGAAVAQLGSGEGLLFEAPADRDAGADANWLEQHLNGAEVDRWGNLVVATFAQPSTGLRKLLDDCRSAARR